MSGAGPVVEVRGLRTCFGRQVVHSGLDLDLMRGEILGVVGASGSGKSVLLREIVGLQRPQGGRVRVLGIDVPEATEAERAALSRRMGVLFQDGALFSSLTIRENVEVPLGSVPGLSRTSREGLARLKLALAGLPPESGSKFPADISGGMRKRAGLARAIALDPEILFLDEPTAGLDPIAAAAFDSLVLGMSRTLGLSVFLVTHDLDTLHAVCDRVAVLGEGRVLAQGSPDAVAEVDHPWVRAYFRGPRGRAALRSARPDGGA